MSNATKVDPTSPHEDRGLVSAWGRRGGTIAAATVLLLVAVAGIGNAVGWFGDAEPGVHTNMTPCPDIAVVGFRGSGDLQDADLGLSNPVRVMFAELKRQLPNQTIGTVGVGYPAVPFIINAKLLTPVASLEMSALNVLGGMYPDSVATGALAGASSITHIIVRCPDTKIVVGGYSQGAHAARNALAMLTASNAAHVKAVALYGDAGFRYGESGVHVLGDPSTSHEGIANASYSPKALGQLGSVTISDCAGADPVCQFSLAHMYNMANHFTYGHDSDAFLTATFVREKLGLSRAGAPPPGPAPVGGTRGAVGVPCETYVADTTLPDASTLAPGQQVTKIWSLHNCGSTWDSTSAVLVSGVGAPYSFAVPAAPGGTTAAVSLALTAPYAPGHYRWVYRLVNGAGAAAASHTFWLDFNVVSGAPGEPPPKVLTSGPTGLTDCSAFNADVTIPDGSVLRPGRVFTKSWSLRNCGTSSWAGLDASRVSGQFGPATFAVPNAAPNGTTTVSASFTAPSTPGTYRSTYRLQGADGHFAAHSFWVEIVVAPAPAAPTPQTPPPAPAPNRFGVVSYDRLTPGAAHAEWYQAWQDFTAASNTLTQLSINVGDPRWAPGPIPVNTTIRLCRDSGCSQQIGAWTAQINNYGATTAAIGDFAVTPGATYHLRYDRPDTAHTWAVFFWGPGTYSNQSCSVLGYNR